MKKIFFIFNKIEEILSLVLMIFLLILISTQVFSRYVLNYPITGTEELARFVFIWLVFIGSSYVIKTKGHIAVNALFMYLSDKIGKFIKIITNTLVMILMLYLIPYSFQYSQMMSKIGSSALRIPLNYIYSSLIVGLILMIIRQGEVTFKLIQNLKEKDGEEKGVLS